MPLRPTFRACRQRRRHVTPASVVAPRGEPAVNRPHGGKSFGTRWSRKRARRGTICALNLAPFIS